MLNIEREELILIQNKKIIDLESEIAEKSNFIWIIREIVKYSGKLKTESEITYMVIDMLIGIFGLNASSLIIKQKDETYNHYSINNKSNNKFEIKTSISLDEEYNNITEAKLNSINSDNSSCLTIPLFDLVTDEISGFLIATHSQNNFFTQSKIEFFTTLSIQLSNTLMNSYLFSEVSKLSSKDILTNCLNRRYLNDLLDYNSSNSISYILFDLDNFKMVNDTFGHNKGDELLIRISDLTIDFFAPYDGRVVRYGGDEFIIILEMDLDKSVEILEEFRLNLLKDELVKSFPFKVSASFGIANYPAHSPNLKDLLKKADNALYKAKENGKNQIKIYKSKNSSN